MPYTHPLTYLSSTHLAIIYPPTHSSTTYPPTNLPTHLLIYYLSTYLHTPLSPPLNLPSCLSLIHLPTCTSLRPTYLLITSWSNDGLWLIQNWEGNVLEMLEISIFNFSSNEKIAKGKSSTLNSLKMLAFPF